VNLDEIFSVSTSKVASLKERIARLGINLADVEETFVKGGGKGGQKINKTANAVVLRYPSLKLVVKVQRDRQRNINRFLALRELVDKIEMQISPGTSARLRDWARMRKQKDRRRRRGQVSSNG